MMKKRISAAQIFSNQDVEESYDLSYESDSALDETYDLASLSADDELVLDMESETIGAAAMSPPLPKKVPQSKTAKPIQKSAPVSSEELQLEKEPIKVRENGFWFWKHVIVPPNAYVVHTRINRKEPVTIGLGKSFRYNPNTDAYLVVPAAMQTVGIAARSITKEKQGINILAYLQWQISDFSIAYRKLDFSDSRDPLGIVNAQLGEQAEATIKDKIATMSVEEVLTDKAPIIAELTTRLKAVTEGHKESEGLGIKIVTVQIIEAIVSSQRLWQALQAPFRHQQEKNAHISMLAMQSEIRQKGLESRQLNETRKAEINTTIEKVKENKETESIQLKLTEEATRFVKQQEIAQQKIQSQEQTTLAKHSAEQRIKQDVARLEQETQLADFQREHTRILEQAKLAHETQNRQKTLEIEQNLHTIAESNRLKEAESQAEQRRIDQEKQLKQVTAEFNLLIQEHADSLASKILNAQLAREAQKSKAALEIQSAENQVKMALRQREIELLKLEQEARNAIRESDLLRRLIDKSADIAAQLPEIKELKVLQTHADMPFDTFLAKLLSIAESLGISLQKEEKKGNLADVEKS